MYRILYFPNFWSNQKNVSKVNNALNRINISKVNNANVSNVTKTLYVSKQKIDGFVP